MATVSQVFTVQGSGFGPGLSTVRYRVAAAGVAPSTLPWLTAGVYSTGAGYAVVLSVDPTRSYVIEWGNGQSPERTAAASVALGSSVQLPTPVPDAVPADAPGRAAAVGAALADAAVGPRSVQTDAGTVTQQPLPDLIAADRYLAAKAAARNPRRGLRVTKLLPPGAV